VSESLGSRFSCNRFLFLGRPLFQRERGRAGGSEEGREGRKGVWMLAVAGRVDGSWRMRS